MFDYITDMVKQAKDKIGNSVLDMDERDLDVFVFPQTWPNTSCGFGGICGQMISKAYTTIVWDRLYTGIAVVFFGKRLAYVIKRPNDEFRKAICSFSMPEVRSKSKLEDKKSNG